MISIQLIATMTIIVLEKKKKKKICAGLDRKKQVQNISVCSWEELKEAKNFLFWKMISSKFRRYTSVGKIFSEFFFFFLEINCEPEQTSAGTKNIYEKKKNKITEYIGKVEKSTKILYIK